MDKTCPLSGSWICRARQMEHRLNKTQFKMLRALKEESPLMFWIYKKLKPVRKWSSKRVRIKKKEILLQVDIMKDLCR